MPFAASDNLKSWQETFAATVEEYGDRTAVVDPSVDRSLTYAELNRVTNGLAAKLQLDFGVRRHDIIGIFLPRGLCFVISAVAILKAGAAFLPLDSAFPWGVLNEQIGMADAKLIFQDETKPLHGAPSVARFHIDPDLVERLCEEEVTGWGIVILEDLRKAPFFVTMTNGTTGDPKGIKQNHEAAMNSIMERSRDGEFRDEKGCGGCNVFFIWEFSRHLLFGNTVLTVPDDVIYDATKLARLISKYQVTDMLFTPSLFDALVVHQTNHGLLTSLRFVIFCGEVLNRRTVKKADRILHPDCILYNSYSVSECFDVSGKVLSRPFSTVKRVSCGRILAGVQVFVVDECNNPVPPGVEGRILVTGKGLAAGYLDPILTKEAFMSASEYPALKLNPDESVYEAGDNGHFFANELFIGGRNNSMIKIRGYSVELGAVQAALRRAKEILSDCCVIADGKPEDSNKTLVAYCVFQKPYHKSIITEDGESVDRLAARRLLKEAVKQCLPSYCTPSVFVELAEIPIHQVSGKKDIIGLPPWRELLTVQDDKQKAKSTLSKWEAAVVDAVKDVIGSDLQYVDILDSFFDVGGHSLNAARLVARLNEAHGNEKISLRDVFALPVLKDIAATLSGDTLETQTDAEYANGCRETVEALTVTVNESVFPIAVRAFWRNIEHERKWLPSRVLLTGATGWLGAHILMELLLGSSDMVYCLVRSTDDVPAKERLTNALGSFGLLGFGPGQVSPGFLDRRVVVMEGSVTQTNFGLRADDYQLLIFRIDSVIHCAAAVNLVLPYEALRVTNTMGTMSVARFCVEGPMKQLHYVSTNGVVPASFDKATVSECNDLWDCDFSMADGGYSRSKWEAEQLVRRFQKAGLPAVIYRLGNIGGNFESVAWNPQCVNLAMIRMSARIGMVPRHATIEFTPVQFAAAVIGGGAGKMRKVSGKTIHLVNGGHLNTTDLQTVFKAFSTDVGLAEHAEWTDLVIALQKEEASKENPDERLLRDAALFIPMSVDAGLPVDHWFRNHVPFEVGVFMEITKEPYEGLNIQIGIETIQVMVDAQLLDLGGYVSNISAGKEADRVRPLRTGRRTNPYTWLVDRNRELEADNLKLRKMLGI